MVSLDKLKQQPQLQSQQQLENNTVTSIRRHSTFIIMSYNNIFNSIDTKSFAYQKNCLTSPIQSSAIGAILFSALDAFQGVPIQEVIKPQKLGTFTFTVTAYSSYSYVSYYSK